MSSSKAMSVQHHFKGKSSSISLLIKIIFPYYIKCKFTIYVLIEIQQKSSKYVILFLGRNYILSVQHQKLFSKLVFLTCQNFFLVISEILEYTFLGHKKILFRKKNIQKKNFRPKKIEYFFLHIFQFIEGCGSFFISKKLFKKFWLKKSQSIFGHKN